MIQFNFPLERKFVLFVALFPKIPTFALRQQNYKKQKSAEILQSDAKYKRTNMREKNRKEPNIREK